MAKMLRGAPGGNTTDRKRPSRARKPATAQTAVKKRPSPKSNEIANQDINPQANATKIVHK